MIPHYGMFSRLYFDYLHKSLLSSSGKYTGFKKNHGPPHHHFNPKFMPLEENDYLKRKGISLSEVRMFEPKVRVEHHDEHH